MLTIENFHTQDLKSLSPLQPEGWSSIAPDFSFYLQSHFCFPVAARLDSKTVGVGALIIWGETSWLAHVIVHPKYRNRGIGYRIVRYLMDHKENQNCISCQLAATSLGRPIYLKAGFEEVGRYQFFARTNLYPLQAISSKVVPFENRHLKALYELDEAVSGEKREPLISCFLQEALVYEENDALEGFYLPTLKEGLIFAKNRVAGIELMKVKYAVFDLAVIPLANRKAIQFLETNGFEKTNRIAYRMGLGKPVKWRPKQVYGRIGGNLG